MEVFIGYAIFAVLLIGAMVAAIATSHTHTWIPVSAQAGTYVFFGGDGTAVLYHCECGATKAETINGHWTLAQLQGKNH